MANLIICPYCSEEIKPGREDLEIGDFIDCPICAAELEVVEINPLRVEYIESEK